MRLALYQPDIPQNMGAIIRIAACFRVPVDVTPDQVKALIVACDDNVGITFSGEDLAYRSEKNSPLVRQRGSANQMAFQAFVVYSF